MSRTVRDEKLFSELERKMKLEGASAVSCADLSGLPYEQWEGLPTGICLAVRLDRGIIAGITDGPTPEYAAEYERANALLQRLADSCAAFLKMRGYRVKASAPSMYIPDRGGSLSTVLPHKTVATLSGMGWIGRCALLVAREFGSAVRINTVLTDAPLPVGEPVSESLCGECDECVQACPAGAPSGLCWKPGMAREEFFDAHLCRDCARRLAVRAGSPRTICGVCIVACPHTRRYIEQE